MEKETVDQNNKEIEHPKIERVFVVLNPVAGLTDASNAKDTITTFCENMGWQFKIHETKPDEDLRELVKQAISGGIDLVIAAGGDGTVSGVVTGMVNSNIPMGILPAGTGNALARDLGIPLNLDQALAVLAADYVIRTLDVMETNKSDYYVLNVSVGVSSLTMRKTGREEKRRFGMLAYLWRALGIVSNPDTHRFRVTADNRKFAFTASEVMIANSKLMGLQLEVDGKEVDANDGRLDLFIVRAGSTKEFIGVVSKFALDKNTEQDENLRYIPVYESVQVSSEFPLPVQADGEEIGNTPVEVRLIPNALRVIVPPVVAKDAKA